MTQTIVNLGTGGAVLNGRNGSTGGADSNDALFLDWAGRNYVYLPGVASNFLSVPDAAALDITGDIDIRMQVAMDDWTPAAFTVLIAKWSGGNQNSWLLSVNTDGTLSLYLSTTGSDSIIRTSTVATGLSDESVKWVRATLDVNNGASGHDVKFFLSDDGTTWAQLGSTVTTAGTINVFSSTSVIETSINGGSLSFNGKVYRAQVFNGINGTKVLDVDTSAIASGAATSFTALTGQTVTINRSTAGRKTVAVVSPVWLFGTDDLITVLDNDLLDPNSSQSFSVIMTFRMFATPTNFGNLLGKWTPGYIMATSGTTTNAYANVSDGTNSADTNGAGSFAPFTAGLVSSVGFVLNRNSQTLTSVGDSGFGTSVSTSAVGSLANSNNLNIATSNNLELYSVAVWRRALTVSEVQQLSNYFRSRIA